MATQRFSTTQLHIGLQQIKVDMKSYFDVSVKAVQPDSLIQNVINVRESTLNVNDKQYQLHNNVYVIGLGKAVLGMARETERILGNHICAGIISVPEGIQETMKNAVYMQPPPGSKLEILEGARNNLPDKNAEEAARRIKELIQSLGDRDILIALISGGGSALLPLPLPPVTLEEKSQVIKLLAAAGANIMELNCVRKRMSLLKGGGLAQFAYPAQVIALILSDIVGDPLDLIASGPTVLNTDSSETALNIIKKYSLLEKVPSTVKSCLNKTHTLTAEQKTIGNVFSHVQNVIIGSNLTAVSSVAKAASNSNYSTAILSTSIEGLVEDVGKMYATIAVAICGSLWNKGTSDKINEALHSTSQQFKINEKDVLHAVQNMKNKRGMCLIAGGETTVIVKGSGSGGRNQQLAMVFARYMNENTKLFPFLEKYQVVFMSAGTDGIDGPTDAAGAFGYAHQFNVAKEQNLNPISYENNNDSYNFYSKFNNGKDLIIVGHTGTNVMDVHILVIEQIENS